MLKSLFSTIMINLSFYFGGYNNRKFTFPTYISLQGLAVEDLK